VRIAGYNVVFQSSTPLEIASQCTKFCAFALGKKGQGIRFRAFTPEKDSLGKSNLCLRRFVSGVGFV
jgi:hypothetical protein